MRHVISPATPPPDPNLPFATTPWNAPLFTEFLVGLTAFLCFLLYVVAWIGWRAS